MQRRKAGLVAVIGLGYVGLPLAVGLAKHRPVVAFDVSASRIKELKAGKDRNLEVAKGDLARKGLKFTDKPSDLDACDAVGVRLDSTRSAAPPKQIRPILRQNNSYSQFRLP